MKWFDMYTESIIGAFTWMTVVAVMTMAMCYGGCSGIQSRCQIEQATVTGLAGAYDTIASTEVPEEVVEHIEIFGETIRLGQIAVDACYVKRDGGQFLNWLGIGLRTTFTVIAILEEAGVDIPPFLMAMIDGIDIMIGGDKGEDKIDKGMDYNSRDRGDHGIINADCVGTGKICRYPASRDQCNLCDHWWHVISDMKTTIPEMKTIKDFNTIRI